MLAWVVRNIRWLDPASSHCPHCGCYRRYIKRADHVCVEGLQAALLSIIGAREWLEAWSISDHVLRRLADWFAGLSAGVEKTAVAFHVLGEALAPSDSPLDLPAGRFQ
ncbi:MAG: hypothetical protein ABSB57_02010 [Dehalococcoidia bacterium]